MQEILFGYKINPTTWAYLSSLMMIGVYFKFQRFWSVRNLDLTALIGFVPGLLLVYYGLMKIGTPDTESVGLGLVQGGYVWLFAVGGFFLIRMLLDSVMVRRPLLEPNLSVSGLTFTGVSLLIFLMANVINNPPERLESLLSRPETKNANPSPGYAPFYRLAGFSGNSSKLGKAATHEDVSRPDDYRRQIIEASAVKSTAILAHLAVVMGLVIIGYRHFDSLHTGVAVGTLYLLFFYTSQMTGQVDHVVPAALMVWAVAFYRRPFVAGILLGIAGGIIYYPLFLLPLWCGFYWQRGIMRFLLGAVLTLGVMVGILALTTDSMQVFLEQFKLMFGVRDPRFISLSGFWQFHDPQFRIPVLTAFVALCGSLLLWPPQKNLGTLLSCSAAVMIAAQFWHANQGGTFLAWYLPLVLLTIFRPNLEDRVAVTAVRDLRRPWRRNRPVKVDAR